MVIDDNNHPHVRGNVEVHHVRERCWENIISGAANLDDRMHVWRQVIELRHMFPYSTDACVQALIFAEGDINRATILLGHEEFKIRHSNTILPNETRSLFLPTPKSEIIPEPNYHRKKYHQPVADKPSDETNNMIELCTIVTSSFFSNRKCLTGGSAKQIIPKSGGKRKT